MKKNQGRKLPFFYHWKLSRKLLLLFLGVCVLADHGDTGDHNVSYGMQFHSDAAVYHGSEL